MEKIREAAEKLQSLLDGARRIGISGHVYPDGDALGSALALYHLLRAAGFEAEVLYHRREIPEHYLFLPGVEAVRAPEEAAEPYDIFFAVDAPNLRRLGAASPHFERAVSTVNIDHHTDNENFADLDIVFPRFSSVSEIIFWLFKEMEFFVSYEAALCLYTGIVTDTGRFQYSNTSISTFEAAEELLALGVRPVEVFRHVYEANSLATMRLLGRFLSRIKLQDRIAWSYITQQDLTDTGASLADTENFVDFLRSLKECEVAVFFKEIAQNYWKASLRSKGKFDTQKVAAQFGGGGHPEAAGCELEGTLAAVSEKLLAALEGVADGRA